MPTAACLSSEAKLVSVMGKSGRSPEHPLGGMDDVLTQLRTILEESGLAGILRDIDEENNRLNIGAMYVAVLGQFKRGKTTLINAFVSEDLLPSAITPVTSVLTLVHAARERTARVVYDGGRTEDISFDRLSEFVTERGNPGNRKGVRYVDIGYPSPALTDGLILVDTPGIGSIGKANTLTTQDFLPRIDAAILVLSPDHPITEVEVAFLRDTARFVSKILVVMSKIDTINAKDLQESLIYLDGILDNELGTMRPPTLLVSARHELESGKQTDRVLTDVSGFAELRQAVSDLLTKDTAHIRAEQSHKRICRLVNEALLATTLELKATLLPADQLADKVKTYNNYVSTLQLAREQSDYLIQGEVAALEASIALVLEEFAKSALTLITQRLKDRLQEHLDESGRRIRDGLQQVLTGELESKFNAWRTQHEQDLFERHRSILRTYADRMRHFRENLNSFTADLFDLDIPSLHDESSIRWDDSFHYKTTDDAQFLSIDTIRIGSFLVPKPFLRRRLLRQFLSNAKDKVERNAGRLRAEYALAIDESTRSFRMSLQAHIDGLIMNTPLMLERARAQRLVAEIAATPKELQLRQRIEALTRIDVQIKGNA